MKKIIMFAAVAAMALVACSKVDEGVNVSTGKYTITATIGDAQTRTSYVDETADPTKGLKVEWEANETISVVELTAGGTYNNKYWTFTSDNVAGAKATFTAPAGFETTEGCKYIAIYPALTDGVNGPYAGVQQNNYSALLRTNTEFLTYGWLSNNDNYRQTGVASMDLLKSYDVMVSPIEFNEGKADIDLAKMFSVIKLDLTLPEEAAGKEIYKMKLVSDKEWWPGDGTITLSNIIDGNYKWTSANSVKEANIFLRNSEDTGNMTVPNDRKVSIYLPCPGNKEGQFLMATRFRANSTFTITVLEAGGSGNKYSASKTMGETTTYLMQGTVNVIKATLTKE